MTEQKTIKLKLASTLIYITMIVGINIAYSLLPIYHPFHSDISPMDPVAGIIYLVRDFAQRELGHYVFIAMFIGAFLSYYLAVPAIALASISAFLVGEIIDWGIFTFTRKPLSQRLIWSAMISNPFDSAVFLLVLGRFNSLAMLLMTLGKFLGVLALWYVWRRRQQNSTMADLNPI